MIVSIQPVVTEQIFKIASMEPGAMLFEASKEFEVMFSDQVQALQCQWSPLLNNHLSLKVTIL